MDVLSDSGNKFFLLPRSTRWLSLATFLQVLVYSADVFAHPELFDTSNFGGAPPEKVFQSDPFTMQWGQNWGIPLYHWENVS